MCVIVFNGLKKDLPDFEVLEACYHQNSDGCGFSYQIDGSVVIKKGYMTFMDLMDDLYALEYELDIKKTQIGLHFRMATDGSINPGNCHPFPVSTKIRDLKAQSIQTKEAVHHNGVISFCRPSKMDKNDLSDSQIFIKDYMSRLDLNDPIVRNLISKATNNRFLIMKPNKSHLIGSFIEFDGNLYSNDLWTSYLYYDYEEEEYDVIDDYYLNIAKNNNVCLSDALFKNWDEPINEINDYKSFNKKDKKTQKNLSDYF